MGGSVHNPGQRIAAPHNLTLTGGPRIGLRDTSGQADPRNSSFGTSDVILVAERHFVGNNSVPVFEVGWRRGLSVSFSNLGGVRRVVTAPSPRIMLRRPVDALRSGGVRDRSTRRRRESGPPSEVRTGAARPPAASAIAGPPARMASCISSRIRRGQMSSSLARTYSILAFSLNRCAS